MNNEGWIRVTRARQCPVCKHGDWCGITPDGRLVCCMRVQSDKPARNGGWIHSLDSAAPMPVAYRKPPPPPRAIDAARIWRRWYGSTSREMRDKHAESLGADPLALEALGAAWAPEHKAWAWPMHDGAGAICGIRLRAESGEKWAVKGSKSGLFMTNTQPPPGVPVMICEGPTDTAAALTLGYHALGRPSCLGNADTIKATLARWGATRVIIMADKDEKRKPTGERWSPGQDGALRLAADLRLNYLLLIPPSKDIRQWLRDGVTREDVDTLIRQHAWRKK